MSKQWHPVFARLLGLLLDRYFRIETEVPVRDLPRQGDLLLIRRESAEASPFVGLWGHLTDWNLLKFKGPTDAPEEEDLELLLHVGTGLTYRINQERRANQQPALPNHLFSFWYLAPRLGDTFVAQLRQRTLVTYETGGLYRGRVWAGAIRSGFSPIRMPPSKWIRSRSACWTGSGRPLLS